jgi:DNA-binding XRE family transcriptional regulator
MDMLSGQQNLAIIRRQKELDRKRALQTKKEIQLQHKKVKERLRKEKLAKIAEVKKQVLERIEREERESRAKLNDVDEMEKEELKLIELLQKTQEQQKEAYDGLEKALGEQLHIANPSPTSQRTPPHDSKMTTPTRH